MIVTAQYVQQREQQAGTRVWRCTFCGLEAWGTPVTMHGLQQVPGVWGYVNDPRHTMIPLERFIGQEVQTFVNEPEPRALVRH